MRPTEPSSFPPLLARLTGILYLGTIAAGIFAEAVVRAGLVEPGNGRVTARNIARYETLYRSGEVGDLVMLCCYVAVTALLYVLFADRHRILSLTAASFSMIGIAMLAVNGVLHMAPLVLLNGAPWPGIGTAELQSLIRIALGLHGQLYGLSLVFFGIYCVLLGTLVLRSRLVPWPVGALMIVGGLSHIGLRMTTILAPSLSHAIPRQIGMIPPMGELAFAGWLILFGAGTRTADKPAATLQE
jgi:hypothetical protein